MLLRTFLKHWRKYVALAPGNGYLCLIDPHMARRPVIPSLSKNGALAIYQHNI